MTPEVALGEVALVTGGETGIGAAICDALREKGFEVITASRRKGYDLTDVSAVRSLAASLKRLDVLVNNAGIAEAAPLKRTTDEFWDRHLAINVTAPFHLARETLPLLQASPRGHIINVCSIASLEGAPYVAAYTASKHALLGLTRALALELKKVRVDAVCPGFVDSPLTARSIANIVEATGRTEAEAREQLAALNPGGKLIQPKDVAAAVVELLETDGTGRETVLR
ncbi:MAG: SDR family oxidoreductase [Planctomycetota bacterium]